VAAVIGDPIRRSLSPAIHNAAFRVLDLDWVYVAFPVAAGDVVRALDGMRGLGVSGLSVTMPCKQAASRAVEVRDQDAEVLDAVNCIVNDAGVLIGHNTDGAGFVAGAADAGFEPVGRRVVVLGAGGAARAVILALARAGAGEIVVVNRSRDRAYQAVTVAERGGGTGRVGGLADIAGADLVVNATSVGMGASDIESGAMPIPAELVDSLIAEGQFVADLVTHPVETPLLRAAVRAGARPVDGLGMLVHQAAIAFERWTGVEAPLAVMHTAARRGQV
jgi:shikimate dehydrogenase